jgi:predicted RNA-binding Zn-ribbon protein involved in translation (DUF1610 family)
MDDFEHNQEYLDSVLEVPCPSCGDQLSYSAKKQMIDCDHCGFEKPIDEANDMVEERCLREAASAMQTYTPQTISKKVMDCQSCGAQLMVEDSVISTRCNFCGSEKINETATQKNMIQPQGIIPFVIDKRKAVEEFRTWIKKGWFHPNKLKRLADLGDVHGIYVPFWTYDAQTHANWSGEAGFHYYVTETYYEDGEEQTREVQKTRWEYRSGSFDKFFDDVLIVASKGMPHRIITPIFPYDLDKVINYNNELMVGWESEIYSLDVLEGYEVAEGQMDATLHHMASSRLGGDTQRGLRVKSEKWDQTFKHIMLPVWMCSYIYNDKTYQFAVNGQTGKINGTKPTSWVKVVSLIIFIVAIIATIIFFVMQQ